ncbi:MAG TPA: DUF6689 family protein [Xanthomonadaceae bacterium]|nr:DUF6689 family protein [Xanthomonadaceae bacterium]
MAKPSRVTTAQARTGAHRRALLLAAVLLVGVGSLIAAGAARAQLVDQLVPQVLPVTVEASGDTATVEVKLLSLELADLTLSFDDATGLSASSLGVTAELLDPTATSLLARLPDAQLNQLAGAFPLLVTIEPPASGGLSFDRTVRVEIHTHLLAYAPGSSYRLFKAPLGGEFRDITDEVASGSVRARGTTGGFSQFLILADLRETGAVIASKVDWLRNRIDLLPAGEQVAFGGYLDTVEAAVASGNYADAVTALDLFRARAASRAGNQLDATWQPGGTQENHAGELISGAATLRFSVAYLRDFGQ